MAACEALTIVDANALASDDVVKILLQPGAEGGTRLGSCVEGAAPKRGWGEKGACMKENGAATGGRIRGLHMRFANSSLVGSGSRLLVSFREIMVSRYGGQRHQNGRRTLA